MADEKSPDITQKELPGSNRLNQLILDSLPCVALLLRPSTREVIASNQAARKVGALPGTTCFATWGQRENPCPWCLAPALWETGEPQHLEIEASGTVWDAHWLLVGPDLYMHYAFDITERKQMEQALEAEAIRRRVLFEQSKDGIVVLDQNGKVYEANQQFAAMLGYSREEVQQLYVWDWDAQWTREQLLEMFQRVEADGQRFETVHRRKDGTVYEVEITANWVMVAGQQLGYCVCRDVSDRKAAERALSESEERFRVLVEEASDGFFVSDFEGRIYDVNRQACESLGYPREELLHMGVVDLEQDFDLASARKLWEQIQPGQALTVFGHHRRKDGTVFPVEVHLSVFSIQGRRLILGLVRDITEQQQARAALEESLSLYKATLESTTDGLLVVDLHGRMVSWNRKFMEMWRMPEDLCNSRNEERGLAYILDQLQDPEGFLTKVKELYAHPEAEDFAIIHFKDGRVFERYSIPQYLENMIVGRVWSFRDVTVRVRAEEALAKNYRELQEATQRLEYSRNMLELIIESVPVRVFWKDSDLRYLGCNTLFARDAGLSQPQQLLGKDDFAMGWKEQADLYRADDRQVMESRHSKINIVEPQTTPAGATIWLNTSKVPLQLPNGEVFGILGIYEDITSRKQAEEALQQSEEKFRLVFEKAPLGIMHYDQMSIITDCNEKFAEIIGTPKAQFIGFNMMRQLSDDQMRVAVAASLKSEVGYYEGDYLSVTAGKITPVRAIFQPIFSSDGVLTGGVAIFEDVSERKQAELERLQFSKLESLSTLAGGIAHDFNNILTAILGNIGLAMLDSKMEPQVQNRLAQAEQACLRAQALSRQLLTFAKGGAPIKKVVSIANLLKESANLTLSGSTSRYEMSIPKDLWSMKADAGQINQVISNLLINADQAMPEGGIIKITAENMLVKAESNLPLSEGKYVKFAIADQGIGISPKYLGKIFDPYFSTKQKGSGLGLATAYSIIKNHFGHIQVESQIGVGTTFHIYLPATDKGVPADESVTVKPAMGQGKVLVMDDEEMVREVLGRMLSRLGYEVDFASDGSQAIEKFVSARAEGRPFAAVILDLTVPGGMGGKDALKELLKIDPQVKAIVSSGYSEDPIMAESQRYGFSEVITKPFRVVELSKVLQKIMSKVN